MGIDLLRAKWWIAGGLVCAVGVPFMAYQKHRAAEDYRNHRAEYCAALVTALEQKKACEEEKAGSDDYLPWGYKLFEWPEGITAWAIIGTGFVIAWQAVETRKAAEAAKQSAAAYTKRERAEIIFKPGTIDFGDAKDLRPASIACTLDHLGPTVAHIEEARWMATTKDSPRADVVPIGPMGLPDRTSEGPINHYTCWIFKKEAMWFEPYEITALNEKRLFILLVGIVRYKDVFHEPRELSFRYLCMPFVNYDDTIGYRWESRPRDASQNQHQQRPN